MDIFGDDPWDQQSRGVRSGAQTVDIDIRATRPGVFPDDGDSHVGGVSVPAGMAIRPQQYKYLDVDGSQKLSKLLAPIGWYTPTDWGTTTEAWLNLAVAFKGTGLWPVVGGPGNRCDDPECEYSKEPPSRVHADEASNVLQGRWDGMRLVDRETGEPVPETRPRFPEVPPGTAPVDFVEKVPLARSSHWGAGYGGAEAGLLLVPATRPADVPGLVGWSGACNYFLEGRDISAVLRSWEDRFGAVLHQLGRTTITLQISRPPTTFAEAQMVAVEHYLLCPDNFYPQDYRPPVSHKDYAQRMVNAPVWDFWWD